MRLRASMLILALALPTMTSAQATHRPKNVEQFETSGLPAKPASELEKEIFSLLRQHKKGDLTDATRIHARLAEFYRQVGNAELEDVCSAKAMKAWEAATGERPVSAGSPGSPPFDSHNTIAQSYTYTDELQVEHSWDFYEDGTFAHTIVTAATAEHGGLRERGFYSIDGGKIRLWQMKPAVDRKVPVQLLGEKGTEGMVLDGVKMNVVK